MTSWQDKVGVLLRAQMPYVFKPADGPHYAGAPRVDYLACSEFGDFVGVEVKQIPETKAYYTPSTSNRSEGLSPGQRMALDAIAESHRGVAIVAVGRGDELLLYDWRLAREFDPALWMLSRAHQTLRYTGDKDWKQQKISARILVLQ